jgi:hypothetical protein
VKKVEDCRAHANECRLMVDRARSPEDKARLMKMAASWDSLAAARAAHIAGQRRLAKIDSPAKASIPIDRLNASNDD